MNRGYIRIYRKIEDSGILANRDICQLFMFLMVKATYRPRKIIVGGNVIELQPGEYFAGRKQLALELNSTEQKIRTALSTLEKSGIINQRSTSKGTLVSLVNWRKYQDEQPAFNQHSNQEPTNDQPSINQRLTTKQEVKNISIKQEEKESESTRTRTSKPEKFTFGEFQNVRLTQAEYDKLCAEHPDMVAEGIELLSAQLEAKGDKYKSHYATFRTWVWDAVRERRSREAGKTRASPGNGFNAAPSSVTEANMQTVREVLEGRKRQAEAGYAAQRG